MAQTLEELLADLTQWALDGAGSSGVNDDADELDEPNRSFVAQRLTNIEDSIKVLRDPTDPPSLNPADIGDVIQTYQPEQTNEFASDFVTLTMLAHAESLRANPSHQYIGDRIATLSHLLPGYRDAAGIT